MLPTPLAFGEEMFMKIGRLVLLPTLMLLCLPLHARAGGFEIPGWGSRAMSRGSAFAVLADDLTAVQYNPGGLSRQSGTHILLNHNTMWMPATFTRAPSVMDLKGGATPDGTNPLAPASNQNELFALGGALMLSSDLGSEDWHFALSISGPNSFGGRKFPVQGGQRYMLTETELLLIYYGASAAYGKKDSYGIGLTAAYVDVPISKFSMVVDGTPAPGQPTPYYNHYDQENTLDLTDHLSWTLIAGAWWRIVPELEVGISGRLVPINLDLKGDVKLQDIPGQVIPAKVTGQNLKAELDLIMPPTLNAGFRYRHLSESREVFDIELNYVYEAWSMLKAYDVSVSGSVNIGAPINSDIDVQSLTIDKRWKDTHSVRLGGTWNAVEDVFSVSMGGFWESAAVPLNYTNIDFMSFQRMGLGGGFRWSFSGVDLNVAYMFVHQEDRTVTEKNGKVFQVRPLFPCSEGNNCAGLTGVPANAGKLESAYHQLNASVGYHF
jgi:hypothetical protein